MTTQKTAKRNTYCGYCGTNIRGQRAGTDWCSPSCRVQGNRVLNREAETGGPVTTTDNLRAWGICIAGTINPMGTDE